ncbi:FMN-dependent oxidoreductase, nitrilotriacetate monooxygenase family [Quadrisphaera granulorum]|uniref:FMN-dependent oxidoreductase (Nitrilotriacetate monooxygenase family) n=1 Tax=Quadrisphaera granulorum TaxID=317664 RepID=A0A316ATU5_9ACTN|nr:NtaA/DmoA family FMN-dependent monooxygenase [Quadrisphaera granulorum]PWJ53607.1 FMN-dependent oxidoreductase (nitrilotriacetate monooxygenase family) [Quadrisphaera granulorum]SZE96651.1 FMN-dependent oxidoreductase, nitrilotriacetate monooxygenase family [Quadrisphaera granulorum]
MTKQLVLGAFEVMAPTFLANSWRHPLAQPEGYAGLAHWQELARQLDAGGFDFLFFAEALAYPMTPDGDVPEVVIREAVQFPVHDAPLLLSGLAATVDRLGFVVTSSTTAERPYLLARRFSTLDHLTDGRVGWNIVTSDMQDALVRLLGEPGVTAHDVRYARADDFVSLCLALWEKGWDDDAQPMDRETGVFTDPAKVHRLQHRGPFFTLDGYYPVSPSPQRTPTLFQAGASRAGKDFAATYAECIFTQERSTEALARLVVDLRDRAERHGRPRDAVKVVNGLSVIVGSTEGEARQLRAELTAAPSREAMAALFLGWSGVDLTRLDPAATLTEVSTEVGQSLLAQYADPGTTVGDVLDGLRETMGGFKVTGTAEQAADEIAAIVEATDVDGFLVEFTFGGTESYRDFIADVMPLLRSRGLLPERPRRGTLREMITGSSSPHLPTTHPGRRGSAGAAG